MNESQVLVSSMSGNRDRCKEAIKSLDLRTFYERHPEQLEADREAQR
jgi:hypothetical protein